MAAAALVASSSSSGSDKSKLSIYPKEEPEILLEPDPSRLELEIRRVRIAATEQYFQTRAVVQQNVERWIGVEQRVESRIKSLKAPEEPLTPGILYVGVAGLTGSVLARGRALPVRFLLPPTLFVAALPYFLPRTSSNISAWLGKLEHAHAPAFAAQHDYLRVRTQEIWSTAKSHTGMTVHRLRDGSEWAVGEVQRVTGLQLREALGWAKAKELALEKTAADVVQKAKVEAKELTAAAKKEAEEVKKSK